MISLERLKLKSSSVAHTYTVSNPSFSWQNTPNRGVVCVTWPVDFKFHPNYICGIGQGKRLKFRVLIDT